MSQVLLSVMIPSRKRFDKLLAAVKSWLGNTKDWSNMEILVRLHGSDVESMNRVHEIPEFDKLHIGADKIVGHANNTLWNELRKHATGIWHQYWSDDMILFDSGKHWDELLKDIPTTGFIVQPEIHRLGGSTYPAHVGGPVPFVPADAMEQCGHMDGLLDPPDTSLHNILTGAGWQTRYLTGVGVFHDRVEDETCKLGP